MLQHLVILTYFLTLTSKQIVFADCRLSHSDKSDMVRKWLVR